MTEKRSYATMADRRTLNNPQCPFCGAATKGKTADPEFSAEGIYERVRNYTCLADSRHRFKTVETVRDTPLLVLKSSQQRLETFERDKILRGIKLAAYMLCPGESLEPCRELVDEAVKHLLKHKKPQITQGNGRIYSSKDIGESVLYVLYQKTPASAWMRYALKFYGKDDDAHADSFEETLELLRKKYAEFRGRGE